MILEGTTAALTGGNSGIGLAAAKLFAREGAKIAIFGRDRSSLDAACHEISGDVVSADGDVADVDDLRRFFESVANHHGKIDILAANAGVAKFALFAEFPESMFDEIVSVNLKGVFLTVQTALPHLNDGASVILTGSSMASNRGAALNTVYLATKAAVRSLARSLAAELVGRRIRVNVVSPGLTNTPILKRDLGEYSQYRDMLAEGYAKMSPLGRLGTPDEIADAMLFLAGPTSRFVSGAELVVDAGMMQI